MPAIDFTQILTMNTETGILLIREDMKNYVWNVDWSFSGPIEGTESACLRIELPLRLFQINEPPADSIPEQITHAEI
ncbi:hypothetical protein CEXT_432821 [Caerostris extrusa]|uniref:Uncharacterized protein n=1 Tax=Caerostris extrusa TaxID=172846 RepID=A0AAV4VMW6_CAEEX|nr:hypothetical protein CEXT_432821 [Caerostris extrusa]